MEECSYQPEQGRPFQANHARAITQWSMLAGLLAASVLGAGLALGHRDSMTTPALLTLAVFFVALVPIARFLDSHTETWDGRRDRIFAAVVVGLDLIAGGLILYWTGGPHSILVLLVPLIPFALRMFGSIWYSLAYVAAITLGLVLMSVFQAPGPTAAAFSIHGTIAEPHSQLVAFMIVTVAAATLSAAFLAENIANTLARRETEALAFSEKMNLRAEKLQLLLRIGGVLSKAARFDDATSQALTHINEHYDAEATVLYLKDPTTGLLAPVQSAGEKAVEHASESTLALSTLGGLEARIWPIELPDARGTSAAMVAPLVVEDTGYGALKVIARPGRTFNSSKLALLETIASELATTVRAAGAYEQTNADLSRATAELAALNTFTKTVSSTFDLNTIARNLLETAKSVTQSDSGYVALRAIEADEDISVFLNYDEATMIRLRAKMWLGSSGPHSRALRSGKAVVTNDVHDEYDSLGERPEVRAMLCVPILVDGRVGGMINLESLNPNTYSPADVQFIAALAESTAIAVKNARLYATVEQTAIRDGLTGLYNHSYFQESLVEELDRAERYAREVSLILLDVDDFKHHNDLYGHPSGDKVLRWLGRALLTNTRRADTVARYGGEEFAIIMSDTTQEQAETAAEKLRCWIEEERPREWGAPVTVSLGIATFPVDGESAAELIDAADRRMYQAKRTGKNRVIAVG